MVERTLGKEKVSGARPAGHVCHVCQESIDVLELLIAVQSTSWSVELPELPQIVRQLKFHPDPCAQMFIRKQQEEKLHD